MEQKEELIEQVEHYLAGELTRKEVKEGNTVLSDDELDEAIDLFKTSESLIELSGLKEDLQSIHEEYIAESESEKTEPKSKRVFPVWWMVAVAAAVTLIAVVSGVFDNSNPEFDDYFETYPDIYTFRGEETALSDAMRAYTLEKYEDAIVRFDELLQDTVNLDVLFYQAVAAMAIGKFELAQSNLEQLSRAEKNTFFQQTQWYLALTYWQNGEIEKATEQFMRITPANREYENAQELLENGI